MILSHPFIRQAPKLDMLASVVDRLSIPHGGEFAEPEERCQGRGGDSQEALEKLADGRKAGGVDDHVCFEQENSKMKMICFDIKIYDKCRIKITSVKVPQSCSPTR